MRASRAPVVVLLILLARPLGAQRGASPRPRRRSPIRPSPAGRRRSWPIAGRRSAGVTIYTNRKRPVIAVTATSASGRNVTLLEAHLEQLKALWDAGVLTNAMMQQAEELLVDAPVFR